MNASDLTHDTLKSRWQESQGAILDRYRNGELDTQATIAELMRGMDAFVNELIDYACAQLPKASQDAMFDAIAILAVGGYGRGEMFPHSDVDLLICYDNGGNQSLQQFTSEFVRICWDAGLKLGHAVRSINDTLSLCRDESQVATSLVQTRLLRGNENIHEKLRRRFEAWITKARRSFIDACEESRNKEIKEAAAAVYSLEPDVKRSPGAMRDLQLIRWIGFARHDVVKFQDLARCGALQPETVLLLEEAERYFAEIRLDLHVHSTRAQDVLTRQEQLRLTHQTGISDHAGQRAVERFMQKYFRYADQVARTARRFVELNRPSTFQERVSARVYRRLIDDTYVIVGNRLNVVSYDVASVTASLEKILRTFLVAIDQKARLSTRLLETIKQKKTSLPDEVSEESAKLFLQILEKIGRIGPAVRDLYECGILELLIPHFTHARGLLQFNLYHAYTVDEHTFRTLEAMDQLVTESNYKPIFLDLKSPELLPLSLILHDLGKGFEEDHSVLGAEIAREIGVRLHLESEKTDQLALLIREHLSMSVLAFRRDTSDPQVVAGFGKVVGDADTLRKLYLLTICDIQAVAPGIWNDWKSQLLQELFDRTLLCLKGEYERPHVDQQLEDIRSQAIELISQEQSSQEKRNSALQELRSMPEYYLLSASIEGIAHEMQVALELEAGQIQILDRFDAETGTLELTIMTRQLEQPRCFHRLAGVLTALNYSILSADIYTGDTGLICDRFLVTDRYSDQEPSAKRLQTIHDRLREAIQRPVSFEKLFQKHRRYQGTAKSEPISDQKSHVVIDNETSSQATIIDVFAHDRAGLLFTISKAIYDLDLSVTLARITTHVDQVVDVFYVTDLDGNKLLDEYSRKAIRDRVQRVLDEFERYGHRLFIG